MFQMALNPYKCAIAVQRGKILRHIISKEGMAIDKDKTSAIQKAVAPKDAKGVLRVIGQVKWHNKYLWYLVDVTTPITYLTKQDVEFIWGAA